MASRTFTPRPSPLKNETTFSPLNTHIPLSLSSKHHLQPPFIVLHSSIVTYLRQRLMDEDQLANPIPMDIDHRTQEERWRKALFAKAISNSLRRRAMEPVDKLLEQGFTRFEQVDDGDWLDGFVEQMVKLVISDVENQFST